LEKLGEVGKAMVKAQDPISFLRMVSHRFDSHVEGLLERMRTGEPHWQILYFLGGWRLERERMPLTRFALSRAFRAVSEGRMERGVLEEMLNITAHMRGYHDEYIVKSIFREAKTTRSF
jgi:hypothetical protein